MIRIDSPEVQEFEKAHCARLRSLAPECMVLLKKNGDFPLSSPCKAALYGAGARETIKGGTGSGDVNVRHYVSVEEGLETAGFTITTKSWMDGYRAEKEAAARDFLNGIKKEAEAEGKPAILVGMGKTFPEPHYAMPIEGEGDVCFYILARNSGEGADRTDGEGSLRLTADEIRDIQICAQKYKKFMLVLNVGGPVDLSPVVDKVQNILVLSQLGTVTGDALADVVLGRTYPSGKLCASWAKAQDYPTVGDFGCNDDTRYKEGIFVGYRYFDSVGLKPLFPFGFGLGYTDFSVKMADFGVDDNVIRVTARVKNTGNFAGKETVQLYYSAPDGKLRKPLRELGAYQKTHELQPGESEMVTVSLPVENMACWDDQNDCWLLEKGEYVISLGMQQIMAVSLDGDVITAKGMHAGSDPDFTDWEPAKVPSGRHDLPVVLIHASSLAGIGHYQRSRIIHKLAVPDLGKFTDRELAEICVGRHADGHAAFLIGNSASTLAGGAGETAKLVREKGFGSIIMADGPAGLRISTKYLQTEDGQEGLDTGALDIYISLLPEQMQQAIRVYKSQLAEKAKTSPTLYHYASAIPIGTALAQSWNPDVAKECGDIVGQEMELFGANVWLAPALNIQRSPLCGRNFEYYSEDPLISGKTAAAVTAGVQQHKKCAVTIKHFACNNQETNRVGSNSAVSQRALREIYLKGFEICVKEAAPKALMSSYNLLNGIHTANRHDLLTDILRDEWGFEGIVMTDWGTTDGKFNHGAYGASSPALCIKAGNDLIMPGGTADVEGILAGLADGTINRTDLERCAGRILAVSKELSE